MIDRGKHTIAGVLVDAVDYDAACARILEAAHARGPLAVTALAVHGIMTGHRDAEHRVRLNSLDLVVPDGQPVRWALNWLHGTDLDQRVYGPELTLRVLADAERDGLPVYFYGSTSEVLSALLARLKDRFPRLQIAGAAPSQFRRLSREEKTAVTNRIVTSGARITFVGLGCPRQEVWAYEYRDVLRMPILAVGAAFDFHAGHTPQAPSWMQDRGLEWLFRLGTEPRRLWQRYLILNPWYAMLIARQRLGVVQTSECDEVDQRRVTELSYG